jgi:PKD repeat protein
MSIDFGRVYLGWINLQNMARIAANYAANNPTAWSGAGDLTVQASYQNQIRNDAKANNCTLPLSGGVQTAPNPTFPGGTALGGTANVGLSCTFRIITPIIGNIVGNGGSLTVSASAVFPVKNGIAVGGGGGGGTGPTAAFTAEPPGGEVPLDVTFTDASSGSPVVWSWTFGDGGTSNAQNPMHQYTTAGTFTVTLTVTDSGGAFDSTSQQITVTNPSPAICVVPDYVTSGVLNTSAQSIWTAAGFTTTVDFNPNGGTWPILKQSLVANTSLPCNSTITVFKKA